MDLLDFSDCKLYFEEPLPSAVEELILQASREHGQDSAELALLRAHLRVPENLTVLVGLYRYYFYQHRLDEALHVAERAMELSGQQLGLPRDWERLDETRLGTAASSSFGLLRFYLLAMKAASIVMLRLGRIADSRARLLKLATLDSLDQMGAAKLLEVVDAFQHPSEEPEFAAA
jgi:hypothetical protein